MTTTVRRAAAPPRTAAGSPPAATARPLRRDAARNRERLLAAAATVFADRGPDAGVEEIARVAGVGMGTLYRRFPTKEDLVEELARSVLSRFVALAHAAAAEPAGTGLEHFLRTTAALQAAEPGCLARLWNIRSEHELIREARGLIAELLADAQQHGQIRDDVAATDISVILWALRGIVETARGAPAQAWERHLELLLAGLRPSPRPLRTAPMSPRELEDLVGPRPVAAS